MAARSPAARPAIRPSRSWRLRSGRRIISPAPCSERKSSPARFPFDRCDAQSRMRTSCIPDAPDGASRVRLFGCDEPRYSALRKIGQDRCGFRPIDQARAAQQRSKIMHFAAMIENLAVKTRQEFRETHVLLARDFFKRIPERHLQPDRRAMTIDAKRSGLRFIVPLRLVSEQLAHRYPPDLFNGFSKRYTRSAKVTIFPSWTQIGRRAGPSGCSGKLFEASISLGFQEWPVAKTPAGRQKGRSDVKGKRGSSGSDRPAD